MVKSVSLYVVSLQCRELMGTVKWRLTILYLPVSWAINPHGVILIIAAKPEKWILRNKVRCWITQTLPWVFIKIPIGFLLKKSIIPWKTGTCSQTRKKIKLSQLHLDSKSLVVCMKIVTESKYKINHKPLTWVEHIVRDIATRIWTACPWQLDQSPVCN